jgi:hypothetical protein
MSSFQTIQVSENCVLWFTSENCSQYTSIDRGTTHIDMIRVISLSYSEMIHVVKQRIYMYTLMKNMT